MSETGGNASLSENQLDSTLKRLDATLEQQTATAVTGLNLPSFSGKAQEDVCEFLNKFKLATFALSDKHRCLAFNKCLIGTANIWAKSNIKRAVLDGQWKTIKKAIVERFGPADITLKHREKLSNLKYDKQGDTTLIGYVERYIAQYKKAYRSHDDADAIISLRLNLPATIIKSLNLLDDSWSTLTNCADLYKLIRRYEDNILPYEQTEDKTSLVLGKDGVKELLDQLRNEFKTRQQSNELLGAIKAEDNQKNLDKYRFNSRPNWHHSNNRSKRHFDNNNNPGSINYNKQPKLEIQDRSHRNTNANVQPSNNMQQSSRYHYIRPEKPPSPCYYCKGDHWNSDCDKRNSNLN